MHFFPNDAVKKLFPKYSRTYQVIERHDKYFTIPKQIFKNVSISIDRIKLGCVHQDKGPHLCCNSNLKLQSTVGVKISVCVSMSK